MKNEPSYMIYAEGKAKTSLARYVLELQNDVRHTLFYGDPSSQHGRAWASVHPLYGGAIYYLPGESRACTAKDLQDLVDGMFSEIAEIFEAWQNELAQNGVSHGYMDNFRTKGLAKMMELGVSSRPYGIFPRGNFPTSAEHSLAARAAKRLLKEQRERAVAALHKLGL